MVKPAMSYLDVLRAVAREPEGVAALQDFLAAQRGRDALYDRWVEDIDLTRADESSARLLVERLALAAQAAILIGQDSPIAEAFCRLRLSPRGSAHGAFDAAVDARAIVDRAMPAA